MPAEPLPLKGLHRRRPGLLVGVDETGRGACFGPLVVCAVAFPGDRLDPALLARLADSKALKAAAREEIANALATSVHHAYAAVSAAEVDRINPLAATMKAMVRAVERLALPRPCPAGPCAVGYVVIDGNRMPTLAAPGETLVKADAQIAQVMAASILAKVFRDRLVTAMARRAPGYGLERHAGYGTKAHFDAIVRLGPTAHHRRTFLRSILPAEKAMPSYAPADDAPAQGNLFAF